MLRGQVRNRDSGFREKTCERSLFRLRDRQMYRRCRDERSSADDMRLTGTADLERRTVRGEAAADMCLTGTADLERRPVRRAGFRAAVAVAFAGRSEPV